MSGGSYNFLSGKIANELKISDWDCYPRYDAFGGEGEHMAWNVNPMHDHQVSAMMWDLCCLLHSLEWCDSGDLPDEDYKKDLEYFKSKWLGCSVESRKERAAAELKRYADKLAAEL